MPVHAAKLKELLKELQPYHASLVAVSKTKPVEEILDACNCGQKDFGENYVKELSEKQKALPRDIQWHFIGHLQSNKVKVIAPFISLIQSVDSFSLLKEINKQALKNNRIIDCLLQVYIAEEETKFGLNEEELFQIILSTELKSLSNVRITGLMGMATFTENKNQIRKEFRYLKKLFDRLSTPGSQFLTLSMGMTSDYRIALDEGSNMIRIGSAIFGERN